MKFGIGRLPEQKVARPNFTGRADDQVRVGQAPGVEMGAQTRLVQLGQVRTLSRQLANGVYDLDPTAVVDGDVQNGPRTDPGAFVGLSHLVLQRGRQFVDASRKSEFDPAPTQLVDLAPNRP